MPDLAGDIIRIYFWFWVVNLYLWVFSLITSSYFKVLQIIMSDGYYSLLYHQSEVKLSSDLEALTQRDTTW